MRSSQLHVNKALQNISVAFTPQGYVADELSPKIMVENESDVYFVYSKDNMKLPETIRADGAESNRASFNLSTATYVLEEHAIHEDVTDRQRSNADKAIRPDIDVTEFLTGIIKLRREIDLQTIAQTKTNWANNTSLTSTLAWSANTTTSNPITIVDSASSVILVNSGRRPNTLLINDQSFDAAKEHTSITDRVKYTSADSITPDMLARLFRVEKVLVPEIMQNTADEGIADSNSRVWIDTAFLAYIESNPGLKKVSALTTFWGNQFGFPQMVKKWREEKLSADRLEVSAMFDNVILSSDCAYLIIDTNQ